MFWGDRHEIGGGLFNNPPPSLPSKEKQNTRKTYLFFCTKGSVSLSRHCKLPLHRNIVAFDVKALTTTGPSLDTAIYSRVCLSTCWGFVLKGNHAGVFKVFFSSFFFFFLFTFFFFIFSVLTFTHCNVSRFSFGLKALQHSQSGKTKA